MKSIYSILKINFVSLCFAALCTNELSANTSTSKGPNTKADAYRQAQKKFSEGEFEESAKLFRQHLRNNRNDCSAWNQLAASYYFSGFFERSMKVLQICKDRPAFKTYNLYYRGLNFLANQQMSLAWSSFQEASKISSDEYAEKSHYELITMAFNAKDQEATKYWGESYMQKFPSSPKKKVIQEILERNENKNFNPELKGNYKVNPKEIIFAKDRRSLSKYPHYWFAGTGYEYALQYEMIPTINPDGSQGLSLAASDAQGVVTRIGLGFGPYQRDFLSSTIYYHYLQKWNTDIDRITEFTQNPGDLSSFPYRLDVMERTHSLGFNIEARPRSEINLGLEGELAFQRSGSSLFASSQSFGSNKAFNVSQSTLLRPYTEYYFRPNQRARFYLLFEKKIIEEFPEQSQKTYSIFDSGDKAISFGLDYFHEITKYKLKFAGGVNQFEFLFNEVFFDYTRRNFYGYGEYNINPQWSFSMLGAYIQDIYPVPRLKQDSCSYTGSDANTSSGTGSAADKPLSCKRIDQVYFLQPRVSWYPNLNHLIQGSFKLYQSSSGSLQIYNRTKYAMILEWNYVFPSAKELEARMRRFEWAVRDKEID